MPQRFLKPGITSSQKFESVDWLAQSFYIRIITLVDDFGRYLAHPVLLKNQCFPLREDIRASQVLDLCRELAGAQLAIFYKVDGKEYIQLTNWTESARWESHYPPCTDPKAELLYGSKIADLVDTQIRPSQRTAATGSKVLPPTSTSTSTSTSNVNKPTSTPTPSPKRLHGIPASVEEVVAYGKTCDRPVSEERCRAFWSHYEGQAKTNPNGDTFWVTSGQGGETVVTRWKAKLPQFGLNDYANSRTSSQRGASRNTGTTNETDGSEYARVGKVAKG